MDFSASRAFQLGGQQGFQAVGTNVPRNKKQHFSISYVLFWFFIVILIASEAGCCVDASERKFREFWRASDTRPGLAWPDVGPARFWPDSSPIQDPVPRMIKVVFSERQGFLLWKNKNLGFGKTIHVALEQHEPQLWNDVTSRLGAHLSSSSSSRKVGISKSSK